MHLTVRMAWHDNNWNGQVCRDPKGNTYCTGARSLLSGRIEKRKNTAYESQDGVKGEYIEGNFEPENVPPCYWSINAFGDREFVVKHRHAFSWLEHTIQDVVKPYSVFTWPFKLSFVHTQKNKKIHGNYWPDLEQRIKDFTDKFKKNESIIFFYANYDNPVSADDMKYLLLGCSVVDEIMFPDHFPFTKDELDKMGKGKSGKMKNFPTLNWAIQITHQIEKSVLLPYKDYLQHVEKDPEELEKLEEMKVVIDEPSLVRSFKYVAMDIDDDKCLYLLYKIRKSILKIKEHNHKVIHHDLDKEEKRIESLIKMVWERRGIYPSLDKVFNYFLEGDNKELAEAIKPILTKKYDLIQCFEDIAKEKIPDELEEYEEDLLDLFDNRQFKRQYKSYLRLALFNLTSHQIKRMITQFSETIIEGLEENPYLIYEYYVPEPPENELDIPDLQDETIEVYKIDVGMIPDRKFVTRHRKVQNISESSPERIRGLIIEYLWYLESQGHTYDNLRNIVKSIRESPLIYKMEVKIDENGIMNLEEEYLSHFQERLHIEAVELEKYVYLKELYRAEQKIKNIIESLLNRSSHPDPNIDYMNHINTSINTLKNRIKDFEENQFLKERTQLYKNILSNSLFLLTGKPGSGKTYETSHVIRYIKKLNQGLVVLAPTGKAALRMSENIKLNTGIDIKAITIDRFIYEHNFWWAYEGWDRLHDLPEKEKITVTNLIIDESSMIDLQKLYILFSIIRFNNDYPKRLIFVGDENQLPPIGFGKPFHDIIDHVISKKDLFENHYIHLTTNCRQEHDLNIIKLAESFSDKTRYFEESLNLLNQEGEVSEGLELHYWKKKDELFQLVQQRVAELLQTELKKEYISIDDKIKNTKSPDIKKMLEKRKQTIASNLNSKNVISQFNLIHGLYENGYVPNKENCFREFLNLENIQILSPYRPGFYGVLRLNKMIQTHYRDTTYKDYKTPFYHADKLIRIVNYYSGYGRNKKLILSNGSIGIINTHKSKKKYYFKDADNVLDKIDDEENFELAYAITIHKSQGSDFTNVLLIIPNKMNLLNKELIYTALTRSKQRLILFLFGDSEENLLVKAKDVSALRTRQTSIFEKPEDKHIKYYPRKGEKPVKSKSEYIIHKALQKSGLNFQYEQALKLKKLNFLVHPDFVIELEDGSKIYWEHLGMLDTRKYFNDWKRRRKDYEEHGLLGSVVTTDDMNGINDVCLEKVIDDIRNNRLQDTPDNKFSLHHYGLY
jgi:ATP-dependent exoDNAse (exonuclease V) alpha subunit